MRKTPIEKFDIEIKKILDEYGDDIQENLEVITKSVAQKGAKAVRDSSHIEIKGEKYWKQWRSEINKPNRLTVEATIYNSKLYPLAHLLEHGHETYNQFGGPYRRTPAHPHILEVGDDIIDQYEREVESKL